MSDFATNLLHDLRARRLLPVALLLVAAIVALPVFLLKPSSASTDTASVAQPTVEADAAAGLVTGVLDGSASQASDLDAFDAKDPFAAPRGEREDGEDGAAPDGDVPDDDPPAGGVLAPDVPSSEPPAAPPDSTPELPAPEQAPPEQRSFAYTLDLTYVGQQGERRYRNLERLRMLPSTAAPLLVFLGIEEGGGRATFLVDATVTLLDGEATCTPSRTECATLSLEPGERQAFADDQGLRYLIQVDQIREHDVAASADASPRAGIARPSGVRRRFVLPTLVDVVSEVQR